MVRVRAVAATLLASVACASCKKPAPPPSVEAGPAPSNAIVTEPKADAGRDGGTRIAIGTYADAGAGPHAVAVADAGVLAGLPLASDAMELVAIGKSTASRVLWLQDIGGRTWLSARNLDAFADGDGPLVKGKDPLEKLPYKPGVHSMRVVGAYPHLFVLRTKDVEGRMESPEPTVFVYTAEERGPGTWKEAKPLGTSWFPNAFIAYRDGALLVTGQIELNGGPFYNQSHPGTTLTFVGPDGTVSDPKLGVHPHFMAWSAASDGDTLTLIGTVAIPPKAKDEDWDASGVNLWRIKGGAGKRIPIQQNLGIAMEMYSARVSERNGKAIAIPPGLVTAEESWRPNAHTVFEVEDDKAKARTFVGNESCYVKSALPAGDDIYGLRVCYSDGVIEDLVRLRADGKTEKLPLPSLVKDPAGGYRVAKSDAEKKKAIGCVVNSIVVRGRDDVWASAFCGGTGEWDGRGSVPIVLRRGRPQEPIVLP